MSISPARIHVVSDPLSDEHRSRGYHPERPERLGAARRGVALSGVEALDLAARDATDADLERAHDRAYLDELARLSGHYAALDADTYLAPRSVDAARRGAGGTIAMVEALLQDASVKSGAVLLRPPGHHATRDQGMGFCLLNNAAIGALWALDHGLSRVAIVDWDVHHGNGTQNILWNDPRALYVSLHEAPLYPGSGAREEVGQKDGAGFTVNVPLSEGATDAVYALAFDELIVPVLEKFAPELVLISAGFDAHERDPLASMRLTAPGYAYMGAALARVAAASGQGRVGIVMEGGYDLTAIEVSLAATIQGVVRADSPRIEGEVGAAHASEVAAAKAVSSRWWPGI
jgi:acetoin utilization deacetylase AcuC-like enzyme